MIINQIAQGGGTTPTGTKQITSNGTHDVAGYANADVQVPTSAPDFYIEKTIDANGVIRNNSHISSFSSIKNITNDCLRYAFYGNTEITQAPDLSNLREGSLTYTFCGASNMPGAIDILQTTPILMPYAFSGTKITSFKTGGTYEYGLSLQNNQLSHTCENCSSLTNFELKKTSSFSDGSLDYVCSGCSSLTSLVLDFSSGQSGTFKYSFQNCTSLATVDLSKWTDWTAGYNAWSSTFLGCTSLTTILFTNLKKIGRSSSSYCQGFFTSVLQGCTSLTKVEFPSLEEIYTNSGFSRAFYNSGLKELWFYALRAINSSDSGIFSQALYGTTNCVVHFPIRMQSALSNKSAIMNGMSGTNTTILFDIVTTLSGADSNSYTRQQKNSISGATAWIYNDTLYYTSGNTEPQVGDTIYSDSACTIAVTTIDSIA